MDDEIQHNEASGEAGTGKNEAETANVAHEGAADVHEDGSVQENGHDTRSSGNNAGIEGVADHKEPLGTVHYADGTSATGSPGIPRTSPGPSDLPRPTPPDVNKDHQTVIDYLHEMIAWMEDRLLAAGVRI